MPIRAICTSYAVCWGLKRPDGYGTAAGHIAGLFDLQIDKEGAQPQRVQQELADIGLLPEEWGGEVPMVPVRIAVMYLKSDQISSLFVSSSA